MARTHNPEALDRLYRDLGFTPLNHWWGRGEMLLGLLTMGTSLFFMLYLAVDLLLVVMSQRGTFVDGSLILPSVAATALFALGGYLTLVGHRRHLYESNDRLTAYLAELIRPSQPRPAEPPNVPSPAGAAAPTGNGLQTTEART
jgi:hypothetical protein